MKRLALTVRNIIGGTFLCGACATAFAQAPAPVQNHTSEAAKQQSRQQSMNDQIMNRQNQNRDEFFKMGAQKGQDRRKSRGSESDYVTSEDLLPAAERKLLEPSAEDRRQYAEFLRDPNTGIFKLLVAERAAAGGVVSIEELEQKKTALTLFGGGSFYSFTKKKHDPSEWIDIALQNDLLKTGIAGFCLGAMTLIGDVPLEVVKPDSVGVAHLAQFQPPVDFTQANTQFQQNAAGYQADGFIYKSWFPPMLNQVYVLRSTIYKRSDALIAFRIIRQDKDGALTILWKSLATYTPPKMINLPKETNKWMGGQWLSRADTRP